MAPSVSVFESFYYVVRERGAPLGFCANDAALRDWARSTPAARLLDALAGPPNGDLMVCLAGVPHVDWGPDDRVRLIDVLVTRLTDDRDVEVAADGYRETWKVGRKAADALADVVEAADGDDFARRAVLACSDDLHALWFLRFAVNRLRPFDTVLARTLAEVVGDSARPAAARLAAFEALGVGVTRNASVYGDVASACGAALADLVGDASVDAALRRELADRLIDIAPRRVDELQAAGILESGPVPALELLSRSGMRVRDDARAKAFAGRVSYSAVLDSLRGGSEEQLRAALWLAPFVARRHEGVDDIVFLAANLLGEKALRGEAGWALSQILEPRLKARLAGAEELVLRVVRMQRDAVPSRFDEVGNPWFLPVEAVTTLLRTTAADRAEGAHVRWWAMQGLPVSERAAAVLNALLDVSEDADLRVMAGTRGRHDIRASELAVFADTTTKPWRMLEGVDALPMCEPGESVPIQWLLECARLATDQALFRQAVVAITFRLSEIEVVEDRERVLFEKLRARCTPDPFAPVAEDEALALAAARLLCLAGDIRDVDIIGHGAACGLWYRESVPSDGLGQLVNGVAPSGVGEARLLSELEPSIRRHFGGPEQRLVRARAYVWLARRHAAQERTHLAAHCWRHALDYNPDDLDARRALRGMEGP